MRVAVTLAVGWVLAGPASPARAGEHGFDAEASLRFLRPTPSQMPVGDIGVEMGASLHAGGHVRFGKSLFAGADLQWFLAPSHGSPAVLDVKVGGSSKWFQGDGDRLLYWAGVTVIHDHDDEGAADPEALTTSAGWLLGITRNLEEKRGRLVRIDVFIGSFFAKPGNELNAVVGLDIGYAIRPVLLELGFRIDGAMGAEAFFGAGVRFGSFSGI